MRIDERTRTFEVTLPLKGRRPRTVVVREARRGRALIEIRGGRVSAPAAADVASAVRHLLRMDDDLSPFYVLVADDPDLAWVASGAGRMIRSPTVFEEVVKTICTTNCSWGATVRMITALVSSLGERAVGAPPEGPYGRAFPTPAAMAAQDDTFYRDVVRAGYRGAYLRSLAVSVAEGRLDLEALATATPAELPDDELGALLLALPGVGPYAAAHIMMMLGRYSTLILDSWTRPTYARLAKRRSVADAAITRRFGRYGPYAGLAFWLFVTRDWAAYDGRAG